MSLHACHAPGIARLKHGLITHRAALDSSEMGTGKTWRALAAVKELGANAFVVCLKSAKAAWQDAAEALGVPLVGVENYQAIRAQGRQWWLGGKKGAWKPHFGSETVFIFDECHKCNGKGTWNSVYVMQARRQGFRVLLLSATPASSPLQMRALGFVLGLHDGKNYWDWLTRWGLCRGYYGGVGMSPANEARAMFLIGQELNDRGVSYSIPLRDIVDAGFPENNIKALRVECAKQEKIAELYQELGEKLAELEQKKLEAKDLLTIQLRLRQEIELLKVPEIIEMTDDVLESSNKSVIIFVNFRDTCFALRDKFHGSCSVVGEQQDGERRNNINWFQDGNARVMIATIASGGTSINLHDTVGNRPRHVLMCPTFSAPDLVQALGRAHRLGSKSPTAQQILFVSGTVEQRVYSAVKRKLSNLQKLTNYDLLGL